MVEEGNVAENKPEDSPDAVKDGEAAAREAAKKKLSPVEAAKEAAKEMKEATEAMKAENDRKEKLLQEG